MCGNRDKQQGFWLQVLNLVTVLRGRRSTALSPPAWVMVSAPTECVVNGARQEAESCVPLCGKITLTTHPSPASCAHHPAHMSHPPALTCVGLAVVHRRTSSGCCLLR
jgi:hypothetical protein